MKMHIDQETVKEIGTYIVPRIARTKISLPILEGMCVTSHANGMIEAICTDLDEMYIYKKEQGVLDGAAIEGCAIVIPMATCKVLFPANAKHEVVLTFDEQNVAEAQIIEYNAKTMTRNVRTLKFVGAQAAEYPHDCPMSDDKTERFELKSVSAFMGAVRSFAPFCSDNSQRATDYVHVGSPLQTNDVFPQMAATDERRLVYTILDWPKTAVSVTIPTTKSMLGKYPDVPGAFVAGERTCEIECGRLTVRFKRQEWWYPNYTQAIPTENMDKKFCVPYSLLAALKRASKMNGHAEFSAEGCTIRAEDTVEHVPCDTGMPLGEPMVAINPQFVYELLEVYEHDIVFNYSDPDHPLVVKDDIGAVVMPMRV